jgi:hypothetical protein
MYITIDHNRPDSYVSQEMAKIAHEKNQKQRMTLGNARSNRDSKVQMHMQLTVKPTLKETKTYKNQDNSLGDLFKVQSERQTRSEVGICQQKKKCTRCCARMHGKKRRRNKKYIYVQKHLQRHKDHNSHQDAEERATEDTLVLAGRTILLGRLVEARGSGGLVGVSGGSARARVVGGIVAGVAGHNTGATLAGGDAVGGGTSGRTASAGRVGLVSTEIHVETGGAEGGQNGGVVRDLDITLHGVGVGVDVRVVAGLLGRRGSIVALHADLADGGEVVAVLLDVLAVPVNDTTGPIDCALGVAGLAGGPEGHLQTGGSLGELVLLGGGVVGVGLLKGALDGAIDDPVDLLGGPVDLVGVPVAVGILAFDRDVTTVAP